MQTPKDFEFLSACIFQRLNETVSVSTLKRLWGYTAQYATTRTATLNLLAHFVGYDSYEAFVNTSSTTNEASPTDTVPVSPEDTPSTPTSPSRRRWYILAALLFILAVLFFILRTALTPTVDIAKANLQLSKGQEFRTSDDYLRLFGITATADNFYDQPLPHHQGIIVWSPQYHHPHWHNEGNADSLLPTITEYWTPDTLVRDVAQQALVRQKNENLFFTVMRTNELRITFMSGLRDSAFVFLGIYRADLTQSDSTHVVWQRIADECDLRNLDYLEQLRH